MTCYNCFKCGRYEHISKFGWARLALMIKNLGIDKEIPLCKWCLTKAGIGYKVVDDFVKIDSYFTRKSSEVKE